MDENTERIENFDDALRSAQEQVIQPESAPVEAEPTPEVQPEASPEQQPEPQPMTQPDPQTMQMIAQTQQQNQQLAQQVQQLQAMLTEISNKNQNTVVEEALTPPTLNFSELWSEDENIVKQRQAQYAQQMAEYTEKQMMSKLAPMLESAQLGMMERQRREALNGLEQVPELAGIMGMTDTLEKIIQTNPALVNSNVPIEDQLITAYAIAKGAEAIRMGQQPIVQPKEPSVEDFIQAYSQNPDLQKRIEQMRASKAAEAVADVPPMSASSGMFNAAPTTQEKPKDFEEAKRLAFARMGL